MILPPQKFYKLQGTDERFCDPLNSFSPSSWQPPYAAKAKQKLTPPPSSVFEQQEESESQAAVSGEEAMAGFPSSGARHLQSSDGGGVDVESADPPPATSCHVALDIPEPVHKSDDPTVVVGEDMDPCCLKTTLGVYVLVLVFISFSFILWVATTKMTWKDVLAVVMCAALIVLLFLFIAFAYSSEKQKWEACVERAKKNNY